MGKSLLLAQLLHVFVSFHYIVKFLHQRGMGADERQQPPFPAAEQTVILEYGLGPVNRFKHVHESGVLPPSWGHEGSHRRVRELPGIAFLGYKVRELLILGVHSLKEHAEGVADVPVGWYAHVLAGVAHRLPVVADHIVRLASGHLDSLGQLLLRGVLVPVLANFHPCHAHVSVLMGMARMSSRRLELQMKVLSADRDTVVDYQRVVGLFSWHIPQRPLHQRQPALLYPVQHRYMRRQFPVNPLPENPCQLEDLRDLARADADKGIKQNRKANRYFIVSVSGNSNSISSLVFPEREDRSNSFAFFCCRTSVSCFGV